MKRAWIGLWWLVGCAGADGDDAKDVAETDDTEDTVPAEEDTEEPDDDTEEPEGVLGVWDVSEVNGTMCGFLLMDGGKVTLYEEPGEMVLAVGEGIARLPVARGCVVDGASLSCPTSEYDMFLPDPPEGEIHIAGSVAVEATIVGPRAIDVDAWVSSQTDPAPCDGTATLKLRR